MFDKWLNLPAHLYLRITALTIITVGIAVSNVLMSIGTIWIIANWLIEGDFKQYKKRFLKKKSIWLIVGLFFLLLLSLAWSTDLAYGFKDLKIKLPFIVIPLVLATSDPLREKHFYFLLYVFVGVVCYTSLYNFLRYNYFEEFKGDIRQMSYFISHVRFGILTSLGIFISGYLLRLRKGNPIIWCSTLGWLLFYLYKSQIITGYMLTLIFLVISLVYLYAIAENIRVKRSLGLIMVGSVGVLVGGGIWLYSKLDYCHEVDFEKLEPYTANGNPYFHDRESSELENGHYVWIYMNQEELERAWNERSEIAYDSLDRKGQPMFGTLMRYLTSKGARKDSVAVYDLTENEIEKIENGKTSIADNQGLISRANAFLMEYSMYQQGGDPNGHSLLQRIEHFRAALGIIHDHWLRGIGVGDVPVAFEEMYDEMDSRLLSANRHRSHNQFLTIWVTLGIFGLLLFIGLFVMAWVDVSDRDYFFWIVFFALFVSCLFQDMIETQAGVTIFGLFYALAVYRPSYMEEVEVTKDAAA